MVTNVTSLLKTVKAVEDEATRGTRALEATIECIKQELSVRTAGCKLKILKICYFISLLSNDPPPPQHFVAFRSFNPRMLPTRQPRPRSSSA